LEAEKLAEKTLDWAVDFKKEDAGRDLDFGVGFLKGVASHMGRKGREVNYVREIQLAVDTVVERVYPRLGTCAARKKFSDLVEKDFRASPMLPSTWPKLPKPEKPGDDQPEKRDSWPESFAMLEDSLKVQHTAALWGVQNRENIIAKLKTHCEGKLKTHCEGIEVESASDSEFANVVRRANAAGKKTWIIVWCPIAEILVQLVDLDFKKQLRMANGEVISVKPELRFVVVAKNSTGYSQGALSRIVVVQLPDENTEQSS